MFRAFMVCVLALAVVTAGARADVLEVEGPKPVKAKLGNIVRILGKGIAGAQIDARVQGEARVEIHSVRLVKNGQVLLGTSIKEVRITPTKAGKITVKVTIKNPTAREPKVEEYEIDVGE